MEADQWWKRRAPVSPGDLLRSREKACWSVRLPPLLVVPESYRAALWLHQKSESAEEPAASLGTWYLCQFESRARRGRLGQSRMIPFSGHPACGQQMHWSIVPENVESGRLAGPCSSFEVHKYLHRPWSVIATLPSFASYLDRRHLDGRIAGRTRNCPVSGPDSWSLPVTTDLKLPLQQKPQSESVRRPGSYPCVDAVLFSLMESHAGREFNPRATYGRSKLREKCRISRQRKERFNWKRKTLLGR